MDEIIIDLNEGKVRAYLRDYPAIWSSGKSAVEAVGDLIMRHHFAFNIQIKDVRPPPKKKRRFWELRFRWRRK